MQTASEIESDRKDAGRFLDGLKEHLNNKISPSDVREWIRKKEASRQTGKGVQYELLFTDSFVLPAIPEYLGKTLSLSPTDERVRTAFLAESKLAKKEGWTGFEYWHVIMFFPD
jgi:hypothetical protein